VKTEVDHAAGPVALLHRVPHDGFDDGLTGVAAAAAAVVLELERLTALTFGIEQYRALGFGEGGRIIGVVRAYSNVQIVRGGIPIGFLYVIAVGVCGSRCCFGCGCWYCGGGGDNDIFRSSFRGRIGGRITEPGGPHHAIVQIHPPRPKVIQPHVPHIVSPCLVLHPERHLVIAGADPRHDRNPSIHHLGIRVPLDPVHDEHEGLVRGRRVDARHAPQGGYLGN